MPLYLKAATLVLLCATPAASLALERTDLLPSGETHLHITQAAQLWKEFDVAYGRRLRADERIQDFSAALGEKFKKKTADGDFTLEAHHLFEVLKLLKGEIALVYKGADKSMFTVEKMYLAAAATGEEFQYILKRTAWQKDQMEEQTLRKREMFRGVEITRDIMRCETPTEKSYWLAWTHDTLLYGSGRDWVEKSIVRLQQENIKEPTESKLRCRFPLAQWIRSGLEKEEYDERVQTETLWNALGLLGVEQYLLEVEIKNAEIVIDGTLTTSDLGTGLFSLLDTTSGDFQNNWIIPENASSFSFGKIDLLRFWNNLPGILKASPPDTGRPIFGTIMSFQQASGMDIGQDLLAYTDKQFTFATVPVSTNQSLLVSLELNNGQAMEQSLATLFASPVAQSWPKYIDTSDFRDRTIHTQKSPESDARPLVLCVSGDYLLLGNDHLVRETILRQENGINPESSIMQKAARHHAPENAFGYGAMDHQTSSSLMYIKVSDTNFSTGIGFNGNLDRSTKKEELGENEISLNHLTSFLNTTYHFAEAIPGGIHHRIILEYEE
ncbi:MAG: hypothetical protein DRP64_02635 [Verrucomicrobia bacterium]|nr:MAG: hypothetical protein DRP64_02635 [Verrucomicrobiota bacterium]